MCRRGVAGTIVLLIALSAVQAVAGGFAYPVSSGVRLSGVPPLVSVVPRGETVYHGHVASSERVLVGVDAGGTVRRLRVQQRLTIAGVGDYVFTVPGAFADVSALPGSASVPGLRPSGIVWEGFSDGRRVIGSDARIQPDRVRGALPLALRLDATVAGRELGTRERRSGRLRLRLVVRDTTAVPASIRSGDASPAVLAAVLDDARRTLRAGGIPAVTGVPIRGAIETEQVSVSARLSVHISLTLAGVTLSQTPPGATIRRTSQGVIVRMRRVLGGLAGATAIDLRLTGTARAARLPRLLVETAPLVSSDPLRPSGGAADWATAIGRLGAPAVLRLTARRSLVEARTRQWQTLLANPDPVGRSTATYHYVLVAPAHPVAIRPAHRGGDGHGLLILLLAAPLVALVAGGVVVAWAHA